jgi:hypothetical protein
MARGVRAEPSAARCRSLPASEMTRRTLGATLHRLTARRSYILLAALPEMAKMKIAMRVAGELEDDRKTLVTRDGRTLEQLAQAAGATRHRDEKRNSTVYAFSDGSRIVALRDRWDLGFTGCACSCRVGAGHHEGCPELAQVAERARSRKNGTAHKPDQQKAPPKRVEAIARKRGAAIVPSAGRSVPHPCKATADGCREQSRTARAAHRASA